MKSKVAAYMVVVLIIFGTCATCHSTTYNVTKLVPAAGMISGGTMTIPAMIRSSAYGAKMVALAIPPARLAKIITGVAGFGGALLAGYAYDSIQAYLTGAGNYRIGTGGAEMVYDAPSVVINPGDVLQWSNDYYWGNYHVKKRLLGVYQTSAAASAARDREAANLGMVAPVTDGSIGSDGVCTSYPDNVVLWNTTYLTGSYRTKNWGNYQIEIIIVAWPKAGYSGRYTAQTHYEKIQAADVTTLNAAIVSALNAGSGAASAAAMQAVKIMAGSLDDPNSKLRAAPGMTGVNAEINSSLTADQMAAIDATNKTAEEYASDSATAVDAGTVAEKLSPADVKNAVIEALIAQGLSKTDAQDAIEQALEAKKDLFSGGLSAGELQNALTAALTAKGLSASEIETAVKDALNDETGVTVPTEPTFTNPDKLSLTSVLGSFMNSIKSLPIVSTLQGVSLSAAGSPVICLNLPTKFGGNCCWDASSISGSLQMAGSAILAVVSMFSFIGIFKG